MKEAMFYERKAGDTVKCGLCRFRCLIPSGKRGICMVRENQGGTLYTLVYGKAIAEHVDPIEKKPLFHVLPGSRSYSIATVGCNFRCLHCQNYAISQPSGGTLEIMGTELSPEEIVANAKRSGCASISYTYTEPTIYFEYAYDTAVLARAAGLKNIFVTNGYITPEALSQIRPYLDAANIDLKGYSDRFYKEVVHAMLQEVLDSIVEYKRQEIWIELTTLVIPNWNDSDADLEGIARFIAGKVGIEVPWHVSQFYPTYKLLDQPRTPLATLDRARQIGKNAGLRYVYEGNVPGSQGEHTFCPECGELLIHRTGYITASKLAEGKCGRCKFAIDGIWL
ncbi:AmmeMemoRadiSam system radical SAM enzyme [Geotalea toluenoxydans]|uniref:AmmeMemoRadiSam system radical SAM enzyme n=1 Tax=Geotalea toluenoxydans TaxID=421624 RepID=UPI0006D06170|nr:AmmeMemoRadiSam system radical SAM enzyme [Geotalea toluenoxydans]